MHAIKQINFSWFGDCEGMRPESINDDTYKSLARYVRSVPFYNVNIEPIITEYVILDDVNTFGDSVVASIQYNSHGHISSVGGKMVADGHIIWSCYAD